MFLFKKKKYKPIRGSRKIRFRELPWLNYFKYFAILLIVGVLGYQFLSLRFHAEKLSQTQSTNNELAQKVSLLTSDLNEERISMQSSLAEQTNDLTSMKDQLSKLSGDLSTTKQANADLSTQLSAYKTQNDVLRQKLDTILGQASRSGSELSPSAVGKSGLTVTDLQKLTKGSALAGIEPALLKIETDYNCNALYALAVAKLETGGGTSTLSKTQNNLFGMRGSKDWLSYATKSDSVIAFGKLMKTNYFSKGYTTLDRIGPRYAEGSTTWAPKAKNYMLNDMRKVH
jgi:flagellum-specific peptidoglycan hydrolase FlgJ